MGNKQADDMDDKYAEYFESVGFTKGITKNWEPDVGRSQTSAFCKEVDDCSYCIAYFPVSRCYKISSMDLKGEMAEVRSSFTEFGYEKAYKKWLRSKTIKKVLSND